MGSVCFEPKPTGTMIPELTSYLKCSSPAENRKAQLNIDPPRTTLSNLLQKRFMTSLGQVVQSVRKYRNFVQAEVKRVRNDPKAAEEVLNR